MTNYKKPISFILSQLAMVSGVAKAKPEHNRYFYRAKIRYISDTNADSIGLMPRSSLLQN